MNQARGFELLLPQEMSYNFCTVAVSHEGGTQDRIPGNKKI